MPPPQPAYGLPQGNAAQGELSWAGHGGLKAGAISQVLPDCRPLVLGPSQHLEHNNVGDAWGLTPMGVMDV